jgi:two-component system, chemotaxis family, protein-glutamate methylesterase/glutaminase
MLKGPPLMRDLVVMGGSAGSLSVLQDIIRSLPQDFPAAILIVVHQAQSHPGRLPDVLRGRLHAAHAQNGELIEIGRIYIAPPDQHMLVEPAGRIRLSRGPKQNRFRPAIDPLFRTAAQVFGAQVIGVVLSGWLDDGTFGLMQVKRFGGLSICQDPRSADAPDMPANAIGHARPDYVLQPSEIADHLNRLVREPRPNPAEGASTMSERQTPISSVAVASDAGDIADGGDNALAHGGLGGPPSALTCPECGGALWERAEQGLILYRCHVGHSYTADCMAAAHNSLVEQTLWEAMRMFQENANLHRRMAERAQKIEPDMARRYAERAQEGETRTELIRRILLGG